MYYHNYVNGERNLQGTVAIASTGAESARFKVLTEGYAKEGAITWQADKDGQGKYMYGENKPAPKPQPKPEVKPTPKPEVKPAPAPAPKPEVKPEPVRLQNQRLNRLRFQRLNLKTMVIFMLY